MRNTKVRNLNKKIKKEEEMKAKMHVTLDVHNSSLTHKEKNNG